MMSPQDQLTTLLLALFEGPELVRFVAYNYPSLNANLTPVGGEAVILP